jgi:hypothetical protein
MDKLRAEFSILTVTEIVRQSEEEISFPRRRQQRTQVVNRVLQHGSQRLLERLRQLADVKRQRREEEKEVKASERKRRRAEEKLAARKRPRTGDGTVTKRDLSLF